MKPFPFFYRCLSILALPVAVSLLSAGALANCTPVSGFGVSTPDSQFVDNGNGTVTHTATATTGTGLMWKKCPQGRTGNNCESGSATLHNWQQALRQAVTDTTGTYTDWRLPSIKELMSIVETSCRNPMVNTNFFWLGSPQVQVNALYWTSTPGPAREAHQGWAVDFNRGSTALLDKDVGHYVRLVRLGKTTNSNKSLGEDDYDRITSVTGGPAPMPVFTAQTGVNQNAFVESNQVTLGTISGSVPISISGGEYRIGAGAYTSGPGTVATGNLVQVRMLSSNTANTPVSAILTINGQSVQFTVTTGATNEPTNEGFINLADLVTNTEIRSNVITITGLTASRSITISGDATASFSLDGGTTWVPSGTVNNGSKVQVRMTSASTTNTRRSATVYIFGRAYPFSITTNTGSATQPANFVFPAVFNAPSGTVVTSEFVTVSGLSSNMSASCQWRVNGGAWNTTCSGNNAIELNGSGTWTDTLTVPNNGRIRARLMPSTTAGGLAELWVTMNSRDYSFNVWTSAEPDDITLREQTVVPRSAWVYSNTAQLTGLTATRAISVSGIGTHEYRVSGDGFTWGAWTTIAGNVSNNNFVQVRHISNGTASGTMTTTLTINGRAFAFKSTSGSALDVPQGLVFQDVYGATPGATVTSNVATVSGLAVPASFTVSGGAYQENGTGGFITTGGTIATDETIEMQVTAHSCPNQLTTATLTSNGYNFPFNVYTGAGVAQNPFTFPAKVDACAGVATASDPSPNLCSGWVGQAISISGGATPQFEKNTSGSWVTTGTVVLNDTLRVRHNAPATAGASATTNLNIGGTLIPFQITTRATDPVAGSVTIASKNATAGQTLVYSDQILFDLCGSTARAISISDPSNTSRLQTCTSSANPCGSWNTATTSTTLTPGRVVRFYMTAGASPSTRTAAITVNTVPFSYQVIVP